MSLALEFVGAILLALGGGTAIVYALSKHLADMWAHRTIEREKAELGRQQELLVRRRNVYAKLAQSLRIFLSSNIQTTEQDKRAFLAAYDEAALWASEEVVAAVAVLLDLNVQHSQNPASVSQAAYRAAFVHCITAMRKDSGFPQTEYQHRAVAF